MSSLNKGVLFSLGFHLLGFFIFNFYNKVETRPVVFEVIHKVYKAGTSSKSQKKRFSKRTLNKSKSAGSLSANRRSEKHNNEEVQYAGQKVFNFQIKYPMFSKKNNEQGSVVVRVWFFNNGKVNKFELFKSSGHYRLDSEVLGALRAHGAKLKVIKGKRSPMLVKYVFKIVDYE